MLQDLLTTSHAVQEHRRCSRIIENLDHTYPSLVLLANIANEGWPIVSSRDQFLEATKELATITDT